MRIAAVTHDILEWQAEFDITSTLTVSLLAHKSKDESYSFSGDYQASIGFLDTPITPGGVFNDLQGGPGTGVRTLSIADNRTEQTSVELRLQSSFEGPVNFSVGALGLDVDIHNILFVSTNATTAYVTRVTCGGNINGCPIYFDRNNPPDYSGHQYFVTDTPYQLTSRAAFGEAYWQLSDDVKLTAGVRYTDDKKKRTNLDVQLLAPNGGVEAQSDASRTAAVWSRSDISVVSLKEAA